MHRAGETEPAVDYGEVCGDACRLPRRNNGSLLAAIRKSAGDQPNVYKGRVLVMDDQEIVRSILCVMLFALGYEAHPVSDGAEAISSYMKARESGNPFDAVIMDLNVHGGMDGREAMKRLLEVDPGVRAVVSSGDLQDPAMAEFARYGFSGVLQKPYAIGQLRRVVNNAVCGDRMDMCDLPSAFPGTGC